MANHSLDVVVVSCAAGLTFGIFDTPKKNRVVNNPIQDFQDQTGLQWPTGAKLILAEDSHWDGESGPAFALGPGILDGELCIIFESEPALVQRWFAEKAPWEKSWEDGPLPESLKLMTKRRIPDENLNSQKNKFISDVKGRDGRLLLVNPRTGWVWFVQWNM